MVITSTYVCWIIPKLFGKDEIFTLRLQDITKVEKDDDGWLTKGIKISTASENHEIRGFISRDLAFTLISKALERWGRDGASDR